jgi:hypothetical protein
MRTRFAASSVVWFGLACLLFAPGCGGGSSSDVPRTELSGKATFDGKPIPFGEVVFAPDTTKGNKGPGATAPITNGEYKTQPGKGPVAGPQKVKVSGYNESPSQQGPSGRQPLFPEHTLSLEVPADKGTLDINVPAKEGAGK